MTDTAIVLLRNVKKEVGDGASRREVLRDIALELSPGEFVALVGKSGSGKSTLLNIIGGLDRRFAGDVRVCGADLRKLGDRDVSRLRNHSIGFVFQQFNLLEHMSVLENVALPAVFSGKSERAADQIARDRLAEVGLADRANDLASTLSGGQKQRVAIARALFHEPPLLLCDEPTGNLDSETGEQIIELFGRLNREKRVTLLVVTHEENLCGAASRTLRIADGTLSRAAA